MAQSGEFKDLDDYVELPTETMIARAHEQYQVLKARHSVRQFSDRAVPKQVIEDCLRAAGTAPNGANKQPWHFAVISNTELKRKIREAAEVEEREFYERRAPQSWLDDLAPLGTDADKPFLEIAPYLIVIFRQDYGLDAEGNSSKHYYVRESVGIATGFLIDALHRCGLVTLTHTPSPMGFLAEILKRPKNERAEMILVVGYPAKDATIPAITKKPLEEISSWFE